MTAIEIQVRNGAKYAIGRFYVLAEGDDGRKLSVKCLEVRGDFVTFAVPMVALA